LAHDVLTAWVMSLRILAVLAVTVLAPLAAGCSADTSGDDVNAPSGDVQGAGGEGEDEIRRGGLLGQLGAVKINGGSTVAAPAKIKRILENIGLQPGAAKPAEGGFRCMPSYRLEFLKPNGESAGTAGFMCGGPGAGDRKDAKGSVQVGGKSYLITAKDVDAIDAIANEPRAVADLVWGADKVSFSKPMDGAAKVETKDGALVAKVISGFKADEVPNPNASFPRCLPSNIVSLYKGTKELVSVGLNCGDNATGKVQGRLSTNDESRLYGAVEVDAGIVLGVKNGLAPSQN
jgi:hypothetical protein